MNKIYYGTAYYDEYMPYARLDKDIEMMQDAGINVVRIAESTWSTYEPQDGIFDFSSIKYVLDAMYQAKIDVIIGTPTYAIPTWLVKKYPGILVTTKSGKKMYGARQIMDITNPAYLKYAERIIRKICIEFANHPAVIGYQIDNETKHYGTAGEKVQIQFQKYLKQKFNGNLRELNQFYGLSYWSNEINSWEDFPSVNGTINASLGCEFAKFQRQLVNDFLKWEVDIVTEYKRPNQFITHNFDFDWRGGSFGVQPNVNHFEASQLFDVTGIDVYHPSQNYLTGREIAFAGDIARTTKAKNYFVLETQAQGFKNWVPYKGQLRLQAYSHIASGATMVEYWHWHSIHNSAETFWKGILSHDLKPNPIYDEVAQVGNELKNNSRALLGLKKHNSVAFIVSNDSLTAIDDWFNFSNAKVNGQKGDSYNDIFRQYYDEIYNLNVEVDILGIIDSNIEKYKLLIIPLLYIASDEELHLLNEFVKKGGHVLYTFKSGFSNENIQVRTEQQPAIISKACGINYQLFVEPEKVSLNFPGHSLKPEELVVRDWMELLVPTTAQVIATYDHPHWGKYAAITQNRYGMGIATYVGCSITNTAIKEVLLIALRAANIKVCTTQFPLVVKSGVNQDGDLVEFYFNYSDYEQSTKLLHSGQSLLANKAVYKDNIVKIESWDLMIVVSNRVP